MNTLQNRALGATDKLPSRWVSNHGIYSNLLSLSTRKNRFFQELLDSEKAKADKYIASLTTPFVRRY